MLMLALRNLMRNRRRSLATLAALAIGAASILMFGGYSANIRYSMETAYVRTGGHLQIQHRDFNLYGSGDPTAYGIRDAERIVDAIRRDEVLGPQLVVATPTLQFGGIAGNYAAGVSKTVVGFGLQASENARMREWNHYDIPLISPPFALLNARPDAAIVGVGVARVLQLCATLKIANCPQPEKEAPAAGGAAMPDDILALTQREQNPPRGKSGSKAVAAPPPPPSPRRIELLASSARGTPNVAALEVVEAEGQGFKELDEVFVAVHLGQAQRLVFGRSSPKATAIMLQLQRPDQMAGAAERLRTELPEWSGQQPLAILDLEELNPFFLQTIQLFNTIFGFIFVLIGSLVLFSVSNTMNTAVVERTVEIGTLRAMGLRQHGIRQLFVIEGCLLGVAGAVGGAVFAVLASALINSLGLEWLPPGSAEALPLVLRVWGENGMIVGTTLGLIVVATVSAWWPAHRAAKLNVVDALRHA
jgi:putative ABC transport system permease protein